MKSNDEELSFEEEVELLLKTMTPLPKAKPPPKAAVVRAKERWAEKPVEAVVREEAAHNEALIKRLRAEREAEEFQRGQYQALIDRVWQNQLNYRESLRELGRPSFHRGPGDADW